MSDAGAEANVRRLLEIAGLPATEHEIALLVAQYPAHLAGIEAMHAVDTHGEAPATIFDAAPELTDWADPDDEGASRAQE